MKKAIFILLGVAIIAGCTPSPQPINYGTDLCNHCQMTIVDRQHAAEAVTQKGKVYKFDAIECMVNYVNVHQESEWAILLAGDYNRPGEMIDALAGSYLISQAIPSPMGAYLSAFVNAEEAGKIQSEKGGDIYNWSQLRTKLGPNVPQ